MKKKTKLVLPLKGIIPRNKTKRTAQKVHPWSHGNLTLLLVTDNPARCIRRILELPGKCSPRGKRTLSCRQENEVW